MKTQFCSGHRWSTIVSRSSAEIADGGESGFAAAFVLTVRENTSAVPRFDDWLLTSSSSARQRCQAREGSLENETRREDVKRNERSNEWTTAEASLTPSPARRCRCRVDSKTNAMLVVSAVVIRANQVF
ncbi:unnamed protein product [Soboliphyme baturini]|uniref:Uncharacterized protein n=1 Tax=Soboliphyme baturini TaxID=241478 RepID=A0A183J323_9BILA|nr:unnamed protein product [Soboliphyme baturini]